MLDSERAVRVKLKDACAAERTSGTCACTDDSGDQEREELSAVFQHGGGWFGENCVVGGGVPELEGVMGTEERKQKIVLNLCTQLWLQNCLNQSLLDTCSRRKWAAQDGLFGMLWHGSLLRPSGSVSEVALKWKKKEIEKAQIRLLTQANEYREYNLCHYHTCRDMA